MNDWPTWAAAVWCEAFEGGSLKHLMTLKFLRAPDRENAQKGAVKMLQADYPHGSDFEAIVSAVPAIEMAPKAETEGLGGLSPAMLGPEASPK